MPNRKHEHTMILPILRILKLKCAGDRFFYILESVFQYIRPHKIHIQKERCLMNKRQCLLRMTAAVFLYFGLSSIAQAATTYYVRTDGGTDTQCTGKTDAAFSGTGTNQACAFSHPYFVLSVAGSPNRMAGGDTLIIGPGQYMMGFGAPNSPSCSSGYPWDCSMRAVPSGTLANPTRILGKGYDTGCASKPQLWGTERSSSVLDLRSSSNIQVQCLEITDHSSCMDSGPDLATKCNRDTYPYGPWAMIGIVAADSQNVLLKNVYIHGLRSGILAGRLTDWTMENTDIIANSFVGWDGDIGANASSNSGTIAFKNSKIQWSGCGETYPGLQPHHCYSQDQGGYGDGLGTHRTDGNWVFDHVDISHNVSDGLDLLYHTGNGSITITHSRFEGNAGNQVKVAANATIANSKMISNCAFFNGKSFTSTTDVGFNSVAFNNCRAQGNTIHIEFHPTSDMQLNVYNSTVTGIGDVLVMSGGSGCMSTAKIVSKNNIYIGGPDYHSGGQDITELYYAAGATGNGDGSCGSVPYTTSNDIIWATKNNSAKCTGTNSKCMDPKVVGPISYTVDNLNVSLQQTSPAIKSGVVMSNISNTDFNNYDRGASWDAGSLQFGSVPTNQGTTTPPVTSVCGNGIIETGEQCDGTSLNGQSCTTKGFVTGVLGCSNTCAFITSSCAMSLCGNGLVESPEQCDGTSLAGQTCSNNGFAGGTIACSSACTLNTSACVTTLCGNGVVDAGEQCDGSNLNAKTCATQGFAGGTLGCSSCVLNTASCLSSICGNGKIEASEQCDTSNLNSQTCASQGFVGGTLGCSSCVFNTSSCLSMICGNGIVESGEQCDGVNLNGQTCASNGFAGGNLSCSSSCTVNTTSCLVSICGNGIKEVGEICDDGNLVSNDGCSSACRSEYCGDGVKQANEQCDDSNNVNGDGCSSLCKSEAQVCGNGIKEVGEICDDGNLVNNDGCTSACKSEYCGDGVKQANEGCDDGNWINRDGCSALCKLEDTACGNGVLNDGEMCDDGNINNNDGCNSICRREYCGDGVQQSSEKCDDGNVINNDGCSSACVLEVTTCGNGIKEATEKCDDGNLNNNDGCSKVCKFEYCGDGVKQAKEGCDDGNWVNRDGCSALCKVERLTRKTRF